MAVNHSMSDTNPQFQSLHHFLLNAAYHIHKPDKTYLLRKENGEWREYSYREVLENVQKLCAWFMDQRLEKGDRVAIVVENCPEYYMIDQALQKLGLINVSIYPTLTPDETAFVLNDSGSKILFCGNHFLLKKFKKIEDKCPQVFRVVSMPSDVEIDDKFKVFEDVLVSGAHLVPTFENAIETRFSQVNEDDVATFIYTSGTTGVPKGAMLTHGNFMTNCYDAKELVPAIGPTDRALSFLPLSHVYERMVTYYLLGTYVGAQVAFAENIEKVAANIAELSPTILACVPRLLEKIHDKVIKSATEPGGLKAKIFLWALKVGEEGRKAKENGQKPGAILSAQLMLAEKLVYSKIKAKMGGKMRLFVSGGGALPPHVGEFFANLGLKVQEGYGLTETSPFITVNEYHRQVYGTVGRIAPRQQVAIQDVDTGKFITVQTYHSFDPDFVSAEGEILAKGPNIMKGYWNNQAETDKVFDQEGWFHTGDVGRFEKGYLKITDRIKNMLVTSLGKNIYPTQVENVYLRSNRIEQIFIIGDKQEFVTAIVVPSQEECMQQLGIDAAEFEKEGDFITDERIVNWLNEEIKKYSNTLAKFERIKDFLVKRRPFSVEDGDMTITLKVKRKIVMEKYAKEIAAMYS